MLADTLKRLNEAEEQADNIMAKANLTIQNIEKQTYQEIENINADTEAAINTAISQIPAPNIDQNPTVKLTVPENQIKAAVDFITQAIYGA